MGTNTKKERLVILDIMQGIAMLLVIIGHHLLDFMPKAYSSIHYYLYTFHMPLFIFISGFLISYSYKEGIGYSKYVKKRFIKFFIPYFIIGVIVTILYHFMYGEDIFKNILNLIISPKESPTTFLWYIYLLFFFYALYPIVHKTLQNSIIYYLLGFGIILYIFPFKTSILCLDYFTSYLIFYLMGCLSARYFRVFQLQRAKLTSYLFLAVFIITSIIFIVRSVYNPAVEFIIPFLAIPAVYAISLLMEKIPIIPNVLSDISHECFHIYLLHMFVIQGLALIFHSLYPEQLSIAEMTLYILISTIISIIIPIYFFRVINKFIALIKK